MAAANSGSRTGSGALQPGLSPQAIRASDAAGRVVPLRHFPQDASQSPSLRHLDDVLGSLGFCASPPDREMTKDSDRIQAEYARRAREIPAARYASAAPSEDLPAAIKGAGGAEAPCAAPVPCHSQAGGSSTSRGSRLVARRLRNLGAPSARDLPASTFCPSASTRRKLSLASLQGTDGELVSRGATSVSGTRAISLGLKAPLTSSYRARCSRRFSIPNFALRVATQMAPVLAPHRADPLE